MDSASSPTYNGVRQLQCPASLPAVMPARLRTERLNLTSCPKCCKKLKGFGAPVSAEPPISIPTPLLRACKPSTLICHTNMPPSARRAGTPGRQRVQAESHSCLHHHTWAPSWAHTRERNSPRAQAELIPQAASKRICLLTAEERVCECSQASSRR